MLRPPKSCLLLPLVLLTSCGDAPKQPPAGAAGTAPVAAVPAAPTQPDSVTIPYGLPAVIARPDPAYSGSTAAFSDSIDQRIAAAPNDRACDFEEFYHQVVDDHDRVLGDEVYGHWTPWQTRFCVLQEFLTDSATGAAEAADETYPRPVALPTAAGRQLFLVGNRPIVLLEFRGGQFRALRLGRRNEFGGITHQLYRHPDADLLVLENTIGAMGAGRGASGQADTHLQVYDLRRNRWLLDTRVYFYDVHNGYEDEAGQNHEGGEQSIHRYYQVRDRGRTIVLGNYLLNAGEQLPTSPAAFRLRRMPPRLYGQSDADSTDVPAGTYRLVAGRYQRSKT